MQEETYNGFKIKFDTQYEVWYTHIKQDDGDERIEDPSLKKLKELLDIHKRKKFERINCFIAKKDTYRLGGGRDEKFETYYTEGTVTSISPSGHAFVVRKGEKGTEKVNLKYHTESIIADTPANRKLIQEYEAERKKEWEAEVAQRKIKEKFKYVDGQKIYQEVYGKTIKN